MKLKLSYYHPILKLMDKDLEFDTRLTTHEEELLENLKFFVDFLSSSYLPKTEFRFILGVDSYLTAIKYTYNKSLEIQPNIFEGIEMILVPDLPDDTIKVLPKANLATLSGEMKRRENSENTNDYND